MTAIVFIKTCYSDSDDAEIVVEVNDDDGSNVKVEYEAPTKIGEEALFVVKKGYSDRVAEFRASEVTGWYMRPEG